MNGLTPEEKQMAYQYALNGADFMFEPSPELCSKIVQGCPEVIGINNVMTAIILQRKPIRLDSQMVIKYCSGVLDVNNTWLFDNGNIKVVSPQYKAPDKIKSEEDKRIDREIKEKGKASIITKKEENNDEE
ncbi:hypothetical protein LCGC14_2689140 [marine sediment metagenome]|uniref:Uncharacterized protein n=1 Tax=marine sediment metagenome TaxID=412755 RepID=A0A0F9A6J7_9ZZZZ